MIFYYIFGNRLQSFFPKKPSGYMKEPPDKIFLLFMFMAVYIWLSWFFVVLHLIIHRFLYTIWLVNEKQYDHFSEQPLKQKFCADIYLKTRMVNQMQEKLIKLKLAHIIWATVPRLVAKNVEENIRPHYMEQRLRVYNLNSEASFVRHTFIVIYYSSKVHLSWVPFNILISRTWLPLLGHGQWLHIWNLSRSTTCIGLMIRFNILACFQFWKVGIGLWSYLFYILDYSWKSCLGSPVFRPPFFLFNVQSRLFSP